MSNPIINNDILQCNQGTEQTPIRVTSQNFVTIVGKLQATEDDKQANINIVPFGKCKLKPTTGGYLPCIPALKQWQKTSLFEINGKKELTTDSFCPCSTGGTVTPHPATDSSFEELST